MFKKGKNKLDINFYDEDRRYALVIYSVFGLFTILMMISNNPYYSMVQGSLEPVSMTLTLLLVITVAVCFILCILRKSMAELLVLIMGIIIAGFLLGEKTVAFISFPDKLSIGIYIDYIGINVFKLIFLIYRFLKVNRVIKANKEYQEIIDDFKKEGK